MINDAIDITSISNLASILAIRWLDFTFLRKKTNSLVGPIRNHEHNQYLSSILGALWLSDNNIPCQRDSAGPHAWGLVWLHCPVSRVRTHVAPSRRPIQSCHWGFQHSFYQIPVVPPYPTTDTRILNFFWKFLNYDYHASFSRFSQTLKLKALEH